MSTEAFESVKIARDSKRPTGLDYINAIFREFFELHGDRRYADDAAIVGGVAYLGKRPVTVIAIEKGHSIKERNARLSGAPHPEGYRKALRLMQQADKFNRPIICFVDTSGAYCGIGAEARGQGQAIAENLVTMMGFKVPIISIFIGEGGSGGALALGVANRVWMLEHAVYSVISPEGCASILWKDAKKADVAADNLKLTAQDAYRIKERNARLSGAPHPEGYRKALRLMQQADKFNRPIICFVDTSGAYCGIGAEARGQGQAIAENLVTMMGFKVPIISIFIGEGGSGGALALGVANRVWMLEHAVYSVISPEGCASILWKDAKKADVAADNLKLTAQDAYRFGFTEKIISEKDLGSRIFYKDLEKMLIDEIEILSKENDLSESRYQRFRNIGKLYTEELQ